MKVQQKNIFEGRVLSLALETHQLPDGRSAEYEIIHHPGGAAVLPVLDDGRLVLIRQFRPAAGGMLLEVPAGRLEEGESPEECVRREIVEEVGYRAGHLEKLGEMLPTVGFCTEKVCLFVATGLTRTEQALEDDEFIEIVICEAEEALAMVQRGEILDGKTQLALFLYAAGMRAAGS